MVLAGNGDAVVELLTTLPLRAICVGGLALVSDASPLTSLAKERQIDR